MRDGAWRHFLIFDWPNFKGAERPAMDSDSTDSDFSESAYSDSGFGSDYSDSFMAL